ncbi:MAG: hypothetical protein HFJ09_16335 [Lachnospiraceae bacterium]|nr:hypothetical protein [Lachnospiraceae bacterium]
MHKEKKLTREYDQIETYSFGFDKDAQFNVKISFPISEREEEKDVKDI